MRRRSERSSCNRRRDPFIIQARDGEGYSKNGLDEVWRDACDAAGVHGVTTLSQVERMGFNVREIQKAAAHTNMATTEGYLNQHRDRHSDARFLVPERPKT